MPIPRQRPKSATATCGASSRSAGCAGIMGGSQPRSLVSAKVIPGGTRNFHHALWVACPYAEKAPPCWNMREAKVNPSWAYSGAGVISRGSIDNTYLPYPLQNAWGKSRELSLREKRKLPHKQSTDLLVVATGYRLPPPAATELDSVREPYSKTIPLMHPIDPQRFESGFVRSANLIPGAKPPPKSPSQKIAPVLQCDDDQIAARKLQYVLSSCLVRVRKRMQ